METAVDVKQYRPALYRHGGGVAEAKKLPPAAVYLECLRNHAASAGGHVVDGCGEFMPAPAASLGCAACGCHRSFHRRVAIPSGPPPPPPPPRLALLPPPSTVAKAAPPRLLLLRGEEDRAAGAWEDDETDDESDYGDGRPMSPLPAPAFSPPPAAHLAPAPRHVLLSDLNTVAPASIPTPTAASPVSSSWSPPPPTPTAAPLGQGGTVPGALLAAARRRFRTKFSPEQKRRMRELSERLGWRLRRRDEATVESCCREIGVARCVFKVWMHNNKHNFVAGGGVRTARRNASASASPPVVQLQPSSFHTTAAADDASASPPPPVIHADFNINGPAADFSINVRAADYYVLQPVTASGGAPQSS